MFQTTDRLQPGSRRQTVGGEIQVTELTVGEDCPSVEESSHSPVACGCPLLHPPTEFTSFSCRTPVSCLCVGVSRLLLGPVDRPRRSRDGVPPETSQ